MKKRSFSLLEIVVAISIVAMVAVLALGPGIRALHHYRFHSDLKKFRYGLDHAKTMALLYHADVYCSLSKQGAGFSLTFDSSEPPLRKLIKIDLNQLISVEINDKESEEVELLFNASGFYKGPEQLILSSKEEKLAFDLIIR